MENNNVYLLYFGFFITKMKTVLSQL